MNLSDLFRKPGELIERVPGFTESPEQKRNARNAEERHAPMSGMLAQAIKAWHVTPGREPVAEERHDFAAFTVEPGQIAARAVWKAAGPDIARMPRAGDRYRDRHERELEAARDQALTAAVRVVRLERLERAL